MNPSVVAPVAAVKSTTNEYAPVNAHVTSPASTVTEAAPALVLYASSSVTPRSVRTSDTDRSVIPPAAPRPTSVDAATSMTSGAPSVACVHMSEYAAVKSASARYPRISLSGVQPDISTFHPPPLF